MKKKKHSNLALWIMIDIFLVVLICVESMIFFQRKADSKGQETQVVKEKEHAEAQTPETVIEPQTEAVALETEEPETEAPETVTPETENTLLGLQEQLEEQIQGYDGKTSIYVQDLNSEGTVEIIGSGGQKAASLIKLYVMATIYDEINKGNLEETEEIDSLLEQMITVSDNESTNELVRRLSSDGTNWQEGSVVVNQYIRDHGYADTYMGRDVQDVRTEPVEGENYTSVRDCARILSEIYHGTCVSQEKSDAMYELLKKQQRRWKIPTGVGQALSIANKTGELGDTENDVAIVQVDDTKAYILCVMVSEVTSSETSIANIVEISRSVYQYFVNP